MELLSSEDNKSDKFFTGNWYNKSEEKRIIIKRKLKNRAYQSAGNMFF